MNSLKSMRSMVVVSWKMWLAGWLSYAAVYLQGQIAQPPALATSAITQDPYCTVTGEALKYMSPDTRKMASLLEKIAQSANPKEIAFLPRQRVELRRNQLRSITNTTDMVMARAQIALELLNAGETQQSIDEFQEIEKIGFQDPTPRGARFRAELQQYQALAYLRLGEQENCLTNHNPQSCIMPIESGGIHKLQRGARKAIEILEEQLSRLPKDRKGAWLLNIAYMTVGEYPDKVPAAWRIPPEAFKSDYDIKRFPDIAGDLGLDVNDYAGGTIIEDFDGDGNLDIMTSDWSLRGPMHFFHNNGDGTFTDRTMEAGLSGLVGGLNIIQGDYNNDGLPDVLVLRGAWLFEQGHHPDSLLRNDGNGHFTDVTEEAGLIAFHPNQTAVWLDYNGDGWLDLFFGYESYGEDIHPCKLYRNNRDGTFTECAAAAGVAAIGYVKAVVAGDFNNDGRPDLYLSRRGQPNILFRNDGPRGTNTSSEADWKFTDVSVEAGVTEPIASFATWFFDYDNDGWQDIFVGGYSIKDVGDVAADYLGLPTNAERPRLYHNNHDGTFTDVTKETHLYHVIHAMGCNFGDLDNDGWLDMYFGTGDPNLATLIPNRAFRNAGGAYFQDVTTSGGFGHLQKGHGVSFGDLDNDGDQDIYHSVGGAYEGDAYRNVLFENPGHGNHWITLKLEGVKSNRVAIGARIKVIVENKEGERVIYKTVSTGGSFGANPLRQEIGLGQAKSIKRVEIFWPITGQTQVLANLTLDKFYRVREGDLEAKLWNLPTFKFKKGVFKDHSHEQTSIK
ncbi:MAG: CRTAC1 family protein [Verrucomicrobia bacterium]|nr:CRTAC1 family protein [Verrucomicrobiota bacterium]